MTVLKVLGVLLLLLLLLCLLRVSVIISFGAALRVRLRVGALRLTLYPKRKQGGKGKAKKADNKRKMWDTSKMGTLPRPTSRELKELAVTVLNVLSATARRACRRVRINPLDVTVAFGGDPASAAWNCGRASAAMYALMPRIEELFSIPDPSLHLRADFDAEKMTAEGCVGVSARVFSLLFIAVAALVPLLKWYLHFRRAHRANAAQNKAAPAQTDTETAGKSA